MLPKKSSSTSKFTFINPSLEFFSKKQNTFFFPLIYIYIKKRIYSETKLSGVKFMCWKIKQGNKSDR